MLLSVSCHEIPPRIPDGYVGGVPEGPAPIAVYHADPFHPANFLFHRLFIVELAARSGSDDAPGDRPISPRTSFDEVDRAEVEVLGDALGSGAGGPLPPRGRRMLLDDLRIESARLRERGAAGDVEMAAILERILAALDEADGSSGPLPARPRPPTGARTAAQPGGLARVEGHPPPPPGGLEAWELAPDGGARVVQFRRTRWLRGESPWVTLEGEDRLREGTVASACGGCHDVGATRKPSASASASSDG